MKARLLVRRGIRVLVLAYVGSIVTFVLLEKRLIYLPEKNFAVTPAQLGLRFEETSFTADDGARLHGWLLPARGSELTVLYFHGNAGNISDRLDHVLMIHSRLSADVFLFDYRGYGRSEGKPDEEGTYRDGRAAYRLLAEARGIAPENLLLFGESLGCAVAVQIARERAARALVLEAPFTSIPDLARALFPFLPLGRLVTTRYDNLAKVPGLRMPVLVIHGELDDTVPFQQGKRLFEAAPEPKRFLPVPGAGHDDVFLVGGDQYWRALSDFLASSAR